MIFQKDKGNDYSSIIWKIIKNEIREENRNANSDSDDEWFFMLICFFVYDEKD
jgi:hypothetical protein